MLKEESEKLFSSLKMLVDEVNASTIMKVRVRAKKDGCLRKINQLKDKFLK
jgi:hypothetical protein